MDHSLTQQTARSSTTQSPHDRPGREAATGRTRWLRGRVSPLERNLLRRLLTSIGGPPLTVEFWTGEEISTAGETPKVRVKIQDRATLWKLAVNPLYQFGAAYVAGGVEVGGDLEELLANVFRIFDQNGSYGTVSDRLFQWFRRPHRNALSRSRDNISYHYDLGNDFYQLWLDEQLVYTCAYFAQPTFTLEQAQLAKMDHVSRKLRLQPGMEVFEAGCGWGALAMHMARHYGVSVKAFNISREQIDYARWSVRAQGLEDRVAFIQDDWRNMAGQCDVFVSVGMLEHVGVRNYHRLGKVMHRCLKPTGWGLVHSIGQNDSRPVNSWVERHIFPGAYPPTLGEMSQVFESQRFSILDVENLRLHYAETLRHWLSRYERSVDAVRAMFDERFVKTWRFYLTGSIAAFAAGSLQLYQVLFAPAANDDIPWTRDWLYDGDACPLANVRKSH